MPLIVSGRCVKEVPRSVEELSVLFPSFREQADHWRKAPTQETGPSNVLYVGQAEYAVVFSTDSSVEILGSDDATTCHIVALRHSTSGITALGHFDGNGTSGGLKGMLADIEKYEHAEGRLECHIVGGFKDDRGLSHKLSWEILGILIEQKCLIHLVTACMTDLNNEERGGIQWPVFYGLGIHVKTGEIFKAHFHDKGPAQFLRSARKNSADNLCMPNIYNPEEEELVICPFSYEIQPYMDWLIQMPDSYIRKNLSTSPVQEPVYFENHVRKTLQYMKDNPNLLETVFKDIKPVRYKWDTNQEHWIVVTSHT